VDYQHLHIYLSAPEPMTMAVRECATELMEEGHSVLSTWHEPEHTWKDKGSMELVPLMVGSIAAVLRSDLLIAFVLGGDRSRSLFEMGTAHGAGIPVHVIGRPSGLGYDLLPLVSRWQSWVHFRRGAEVFAAARAAHR
jgi:hypothetical protein